MKLLFKAIHLSSRAKAACSKKYQEYCEKYELYLEEQAVMTFEQWQKLAYKKALLEAPKKKAVAKKRKPTSRLKK